MNIAKFAVSVQWGKGMHYFRSTDLDTLEEANAVAKQAFYHAKLTYKQSGNHAKPSVHIYQHITKFEG